MIETEICAYASTTDLSSMGDETMAMTSSHLGLSENRVYSQ